MWIVENKVNVCFMLPMATSVNWPFKWKKIKTKTNETYL